MGFYDTDPHPLSWQQRQVSSNLAAANSGEAAPKPTLTPFVHLPYHLHKPCVPKNESSEVSRTCFQSVVSVVSITLTGISEILSPLHQGAQI